MAYEKFSLTEEQLEKAVDWWVKAIERPKFENTSSEEKRTDLGSIFASVLATMASHSKDDNQISKFREALKRRLAEQEFWDADSVGCDYHPDGLLCDAAKEAGITDAVGLTAFPWKTYMYFYADGRIEVKHGYGAPFVEI